MKRESKNTAPKHFRPSTRKWYDQVMADYQLEPHHVHLLALACQALDRAEDAREAILLHGTTFEDRFGSPRIRPEVGIEAAARIGFARLVRELDLDVEAAAAASRPPAIRSNRRN